MKYDFQKVKNYYTALQYAAASIFTDNDVSCSKVSNKQTLRQKLTDFSD